MKREENSQLYLDSFCYLSYIIIRSESVNSY